jgi:hypothetical protein
MRLQSVWTRLLAVMVVVVVVTAPQAHAAQAKSELTEVTLYRDQAQITRTVTVPKGDGPIELVVTGLPGQIRPNSLFAEGGEVIDVRAVRYRERVTGQEPREDIRELDEKIELLMIELEENATMKGLAVKRLAYLDKLENFTATTGTAELSNGVLDAKQLQETTSFIFEERRSAAKQQLDLKSEERSIKKELATLQQKRAQLAGKAQTTVREAVLFLDRRDASADSVQLTYLVANCGWSPSYNARGDLKTGKVRLEYNALIRQMTGEDWEGVKLTLSTASPMISASGPQVAGFPVSLVQIAQGGRAVNGFDLNDALSNTSSGGTSQVGLDYARLNKAQFENQNLLNAEASFDRNTDIAWSGNVLANRLQLLELCEPVDKLMPTMVITAPEQGLSISYTIDGEVSLQSRSDQQMTRVMQTEMDGGFYHVANPVLSPFVYREAEVVNTSGRDLLSGPVNVYLDGRFVGRTEMVGVTRDQTFVLGFGADPQLKAARQLVERKQEQQGGNTLISFEYRLAVENYGKQAADVRVFDRLPNFANSDDVKLTLVSGFDNLSKDPVYLRLDRPNGILRWDIESKAGATGEQATLVPYHYSLEFDKNFGLTSEVNEQLEQEFKLEQRQRKTK